jgi:3-oxoacyl-[acyl-carrier protein] reductase
MSAGSLAGKVALVTGASKGIGTGMAKGLAAAGAAVAVGYASDRAGADRVVAEIEDTGGRAIAVKADVSRTAEVEVMVAETVRRLGPLDVLINNAAVFDYKALPEITEKHFHEHFDTNVLGLLLVTQHALRHFNPAGGSIINVSSLSARGNNPGQAVYSATKAAVNAITGVLALELAGRHIRVNGVMPGYTDTEGARAFGVRGSELEARLIAGTPLRRAGVPSDFGPVAVFLASDASGWITGETLSVSGGLR